MLVVMVVISKSETILVKTAIELAGMLGLMVILKRVATAVERVIPARPIPARPAVEGVIPFWALVLHGRPAVLVEIMRAMQQENIMQ
mmetsp:Transcript_46371/g.51861  ORF Transcript_46371/g.51861 Transcript_46371/m.51861 type:complete len:87 (-) Transcript_46371:1495-1755(-)